MNKLLARFEYKINDKCGLFLLDHDTQISEAKEMAFTFLKYLGQVEDAAKLAAEAQKQAPLEAADQTKVESFENHPPEVVNVE